MDGLCFTGVMHQNCFCLGTSTPSSRMENRTGKAHPKDDMSISHTKGCWLNLVPSPPWLVPGDILATQWPSRKAGGAAATRPLRPSGVLAAGLPDARKESLTKCWIRCLSVSGVNSQLMGTTLSFRTRIALGGGRGKELRCVRHCSPPLTEGQTGVGLGVTSGRAMPENSSAPRNILKHQRTLNNSIAIALSQQITACLV